MIAAEWSRWAPAWMTMAVLLTVAGFFFGDVAMAAQNPQGERIYHQVCIGCHQIGVLGAPKFRDAAAWKARLKKGINTLVKNALNGFGKMPPKGGNPNVGEKDIRAAIRFMAGEKIFASVSGKAAAKAIPATAGGAKGPEKQAPSAPKAQNREGVSKRGAAIVKRVCKGCHEIGVLGAPKIGRKADWEARLKKGEDTLVKNSMKGIGNMPPKGGAADLTPQDMRAAIRYMIKPTGEIGPKVVAKKPGPPRTVSNEVQPDADKINKDVNRFNRLMRPRTKRNPPPMKDGIHDPNNIGTTLLQPPKQAFRNLPKSSAGNYVDWVKSLKDGSIRPRWDITDPTKKPLVMDLNIVREVKGSMPDVVYPHEQHLQWLDCSNCHPKIFQPKKGANQISMAEILLGGKCGICHGKVAFPVAECRRCHSKKKPRRTAIK